MYLIYPAVSRAQACGHAPAAEPGPAEKLNLPQMRLRLRLIFVQVCNHVVRYVTR